MFWNFIKSEYVQESSLLTVNMKCFEIRLDIVPELTEDKLTVNMKCFEIFWRDWKI